MEPDLSIAGHPEIRVIGDLANFSKQTGKPLPGVAQVAMQMGAMLPRPILAKSHGKTTEAVPLFR